MFTWLWIAWGAIFAVVEVVALFNNKDGDTLSEHFRKWFRTDTKRGKLLWGSAFGIFSAWFSIHIAFEGSI